VTLRRRALARRAAASGILACVGSALALVGRAGPPVERPAPEPFTLELRFLEAARQGDRRTLERALARGVSPQVSDDLGRNALLLAARDAGDPELVGFLAGKGVPIDVPDAGGRTAVSWAAGAGRLAIVRELVAAGAQPDRPDAEGRTPLFHAVLFDRRDVVAWLLEQGANVDAADHFRDTPLMLACAKGFNELAALLLARGADPALRDQEGRTARERAAQGADACRGAQPH
jgi:ankyrin repeat protein